VGDGRRDHPRLDFRVGGLERDEAVGERLALDSDRTRDGPYRVFAAACQGEGTEGTQDGGITVTILHGSSFRMRPNGGPGGPPSFRPISLESVPKALSSRFWAMPLESEALTACLPFG